MLGYTILRVLLWIASLLPWYAVLLAGAAVSDVLVAVGGAVTLLLYPVAFAVVMSSHVANYGVRLRAV